MTYILNIILFTIFLWELKKNTHNLRDDCFALLDICKNTEYCAQFENIENLENALCFHSFIHSWVHQALTEHLHGPGNIKGKLKWGTSFLRSRKSIQGNFGNLAHFPLG